MSLIYKVANLLKQSAVKKPFLESMSSAKLFVGGISYNMDDMSLKESFAHYGEIIDARVIRDHGTGSSRGFGFITFASSEGASSAIQGMDGQDLHGRKIGVKYATEKSHPGFGGSGGYAGCSLGGGDNNRNDTYRSSSYAVRGSCGSSNVGTNYTGGSSVNSDVYDHWRIYVSSHGGKCLPLRH